MWPALITAISSIINSVISNKADQDAAKLKILEMQATGELNNALAQLEVNKNEASSLSWFVAGWRPAIGWICGLALLNNYIIVPYAVAFGLHVPSLNMSELMTILMGMLGLGAYRTVEKLRGAA